MLPIHPPYSPTSNSFSIDSQPIYRQNLQTVFTPPQSSNSLVQKITVDPVTEEGAVVALVRLRHPDLAKDFQLSPY